ncbi:GNAT family N-acetyltransferase [Kutzneria sp. CA-103260]|uniref:GNAT family N-acetyltransferase n=1 Tax=Kutzneria sp. CA-103260 TaxID=2802641 RepID=UPI001BA9E88D|nr:GNAT family N-acetyltransferase [Kutzneria sp. CA-103260]QUQ69927.1 GNAT family N-acetyltransferase [Kutzneria sp. CA-103260]
MDTKIAAYLRANRRNPVRVGPFTIGFSTETSSPFANYAVPDDDARPTAADVTELIGVFQDRGRTPRLEYLPSVSPLVQPALEEAGFTVEGLLPLMTLSDLVEPPAVDDLELVAADSGDRLFAMATAMNLAYGEPPPTPQDVASHASSRDRGGFALLARSASGEPVGGGLVTVPIDGVAELAGIGVVPSWRRRGVAAAITVRLVQAAHGLGVRFPFLMAADDGAAGVYTRVGFQLSGRVLHISR